MSEKIEKWWCVTGVSKRGARWIVPGSFGWRRKDAIRDFLKDYNSDPNRLGSWDHWLDLGFRTERVEVRRIAL